MTAGSLTATVGAFVDELTAILDGLTSAPGLVPQHRHGRGRRGRRLDAGGRRARSRRRRRRPTPAAVGRFVRRNGRPVDAADGPHLRPGAAPARVGGEARPSCSPCSSRPTPGPARCNSHRYYQRAMECAQAAADVDGGLHAATSWTRSTSSEPHCWRRSTGPGLARPAERRPRPDPGAPHRHRRGAVAGPAEAARRARRPGRARSGEACPCAS